MLPSTSNAISPPSDHSLSSHLRGQIAQLDATLTRAVRLEDDIKHLRSQRDDALHLAQEREKELSVIHRDAEVLSRQGQAIVQEQREKEREVWSAEKQVLEEKMKNLRAKYRAESEKAGTMRAQFEEEKAAFFIEKQELEGKIKDLRAKHSAELQELKVKLPAIPRNHLASHATNEEPAEPVSRKRRRAVDSEEEGGGRTEENISISVRLPSPARHSVIAPKVSRQEQKAEQLRFCRQFLDELAQMPQKKYNRIVYFFAEPVDWVRLDLPDYPIRIPNPMDLSTIRKKLDNGEYSSAKGFRDDFWLMLNNCFTYNDTLHEPVSDAGLALERIFKKKWKSLPPLEPGSSDDETAGDKDLKKEDQSPRESPLAGFLSNRFIDDDLCRTKKVVRAFDYASVWTYLYVSLFQAPI
ncbi:hypothetical protein EW146_g5973 [Bondarzewia mesenterica]|uniref:Bromo domain-containing protein n=1 Tax=Bondarzewia mesenterica TaxID=1095465 RepID=A0A4S4LRY4_9AGAM|nr:hypothetical protein EW146_g5973 [Bondarzewia mesenterica]